MNKKTNVSVTYRSVKKEDGDDVFLPDHPSCFFEVLIEIASEDKHAISSLKNECAAKPTARQIRRWIKMAKKPIIIKAAAFFDRNIEDGRVIEAHTDKKDGWTLFCYHQRFKR